MSREEKERPTILVADDNQEALFVLRELLQQSGIESVTAADGRAAVELAKQCNPDLILLDLNMPVMDGLEATQVLKSDEQLRFIPVVLLTARAELEDVIRGLEHGADDYIRKPYKADELVARLKALLRLRSLYLELQSETNQRKALQRQVEERFSFGNIVGQSTAMRQVYDLIEKVKDADVPVLITGESGTGKELVAAALHFNGARRDKPFIAQNCSAFSEQLLESELFGHVKGAFTGALRDKEGIFEAANGGTLFLDEIGEMKPGLQARLLRVLQEGTFFPVGGTKQRSVDVRIVAATNRNLDQMVAQGTFREDLYYRLNVIHIHLPPLRERGQDVTALINFFMARAEDKGSRKVLSAEAVQVLERYPWPGNIRELQNEIERLVLLSGSVTEIGAELISERMRRGAAALKTQESQMTDGSTPLPELLQEVERKAILEALERLDWNKSEAARVLGISRSSLIAKVQAFGLEKKS